MIDHAVPLVVRRQIKAPPKRVFSAFTRADLLAQWVTPSPNITIDILRIEFVENGAFRFRYARPGGRRPVIGGIYARAEKPSKIACSWVWEPPDQLTDVEMHVRIQFIEGEGRMGRFLEQPWAILG